MGPILLKETVVNASLHEVLVKSLFFAVLHPLLLIGGLHRFLFFIK
jgi:hypothetical protein